ncbi:MAG TPA: hypothetical protein VG488_13895, partial [Candidatus Angelobacter sp.]|nr:hypothetical protein [Candidatus Angelobacter sp.]
KIRCTLTLAFSGLGSVGSILKGLVADTMAFLFGNTDQSAMPAKGTDGHYSKQQYPCPQNDGG